MPSTRAVAPLGALGIQRGEEITGGVRRGAPVFVECGQTRSAPTRLEREEREAGVAQSLGEFTRLGPEILVDQVANQPVSKTPGGAFENPKLGALDVEFDNGRAGFPGQEVVERFEVDGVSSF